MCYFNTNAPVFLFSKLSVHTVCVCVRVCGHRPGPGGRHCPQASVEHKACEAPPCPKGSPSFRDLQCLSYNQQANKKGGMLTAIVNDGEFHRTSYCTVPSELITISAFQ